SAKVWTRVQLASRMVTSLESHWVPNQTSTGSSSSADGALSRLNLMANSVPSSAGHRQLARLKKRRTSSWLRSWKPPSPSGNCTASRVEPPPRLIGATRAPVGAGSAAALAPAAASATPPAARDERRRSGRGIGRSAGIAREVPRMRGASHEKRYHAGPTPTTAVPDWRLPVGRGAKSAHARAGSHAPAARRAQGGVDGAGQLGGAGARGGVHRAAVLGGVVELGQLGELRGAGRAGAGQRAGVLA